MFLTLIGDEWFCSLTWDGLVEWHAPLVWSICRSHRLEAAEPAAFSATTTSTGMTSVG
jgi:hypothetical protein